MSDIRVDRYDVDLAGTSGTFSITDVGNLDSAFLRITGCSRHDSAGEIGVSSNLGPDDVGVRLELTGTDEISYTKQRSNTVKVMCEVWVYTGASGGAYEFVRRQSGTVSVSSGSSSGSAAVAGLADRNDCIPFFSGYTSAENSQSDFEQTTLACHLNASSEVVFSRGNTGTTTVAAYQVVEFTGAAWSVACARSANHDTGNDFGSGGETVTLNTDSDGLGGSTFDVGDWSTAIIIQASMGGDGGGETGLSDTMIYARPGGSTTTVRMTLDNSNSRNDDVAFAYVLQCDDLVVNRASNSNLTEGGNSYGTNLSAPAGYSYSTPLSQMALEWFPGTNGEGTAHIRGALHGKIVDTGSAYEVRHWIHRTGNNVKASYGFADLSALSDPGGTTEATGDLAATEAGQDAASLVGGPLVAGVLSATEAGTDEPAMSGGAFAQATLAATESATDECFAEGGLLVAGALSAQDGQDNAAANGSVLVGAEILVSDATDSAALTGAVQVSGALSATDAADTAEAQAGISTAGDLSATDSPDVAFLSGGAVAFGSIDVTEAGSDTGSFSAEALIAGPLAATETSDSAELFGRVRVQAILAAQDQRDAAQIEGGPVVSGSMVSADAADSAQAAGLVATNAQLVALETGQDVVQISDGSDRIDSNPFVSFSVQCGTRASVLTAHQPPTIVSVQKTAAGVAVRNTAALARVPPPMTIQVEL